MQNTPRLLWQSRLDDIRRQIASLRAQEEQLEDAARAIVYPILSIPVELTIAILKACVKDHPLHDLLALAHVCGQWRQTALATPELWTNIQSIMELPVWLNRSGAYPLHAQVTIRSTADLTTLNGYLVNHPLRWKTLALRMADTQTGASAFSLPCDIPHLQQLSVQGRPPSGPHLPDGDLTLGPSLLAARATSLVGLKVGYIVQLQGAQMGVFTRLTSLSLAGQETACRQFLEFTPNLQSLVVGCVSLDPAPIAPIIMSHLRTIILAEGCHPDFLEQLTAPLLEQLEFHLDLLMATEAVRLCIRAGDSAQSVTRFFDLMGPALSNLEHLTLRAVMRESLHELFARMTPVSRGPVLQLLPILQALKSLTLYDCGYITNYDIFSLDERHDGSSNNGVFEVHPRYRRSDTGAADGDPDVEDALNRLQRLRYQGILDMEFNVAGVNRFTSIWELSHYLNARQWDPAIAINGSRQIMTLELE
ncbi:hypothetical protein FB45DRAFT_859271 [Roridomyces roridus]|uniref:F-box domain-containing protein n=1 Tax=Roridomyces roridus TaxID=1738132 RepID=A0AAD7CJF4_9AGAR|nr:hypothetical protein FB45DRAFT_859271 [Roridomyces roridus]